MSSGIEGLEPRLVWKYFAEIARIPRCSKHETTIAKYVLDTAKRLGLKANQDRYGNVVVKKAASAARERVRSLCLQGHLDMVCEKNADKVHDFSRDPIELVRKGNVLMANGTTLGADNGIAVATNLAIMENGKLEHGPLELLFTVDEETGLTGAKNLQADFLESRTLLNLDSEEEGALYVGCSGGKDSTGTWKLELENAPAQSVQVQLKVTGLRGGHSGLEIDKGRGNAIKILNRGIILLGDLGGRLSKSDGGNKRNAIPREAEALMLIPRNKMNDARAAVGVFNSMVKNELASVEPDLVVSMKEMERSKGGKVVKKALQKKVCQAISGLPHGVIKMSADIPGLVETSTNVAVINATKKAIVLATSQRSSVDSEILEICQTVASIFNLSGAKVAHGAGYPGWKPNLDSPILKLAKSTYQSLYRKEPAVKAIHAGLECGIIGERIPGMDMVSFGPTLEGVHSPDEKIYVDTVEKFWSFLLAIMKNFR